MTEKEEKEYIDYLSEISDDLVKTVLSEFALSFKGQLDEKQTCILFDIMKRNAVNKDSDAEHDILKGLSVPFHLWDEYLRNK